MDDDVEKLEISEILRLLSTVSTPQSELYNTMFHIKTEYILRMECIPGTEELKWTGEFHNQTHVEAGSEWIRSKMIKMVAQHYADDLNKIGECLDRHKMTAPTSGHVYATNVLEGMRAGNMSRGQFGGVEMNRLWSQEGQATLKGHQIK